MELAFLPVPALCLKTTNPAFKPTIISVILVVGTKAVHGVFFGKCLEHLSHMPPPKLFFFSFF